MASDTLRAAGVSPGVTNVSLAAAPESLGVARVTPGEAWGSMGAWPGWLPGAPSTANGSTSERAVLTMPAEDLRIMVYTVP